MENLNTEQIIKALECCNSGTTEDCAKCPRFNDDRTLSTEDCMEGLMRNALALIKELTTKTEAQDIVISELRHRVEKAEHDAERYSKKIKELAEENERLQKALNTDISIVRVSRGTGKTAHLRELGRIKVDAIRADTVRKMHTEIKERCIKGGIYPAFVARTIENVAREMLEEKDEK